jgi:hypothetical protein
VSAAREQVLHASEEQSNTNSIEPFMSFMDDHNEQLTIPKPNYDADKPEHVFNLDESKPNGKLFENDLLIFVFDFISVVNENDLALLNEICHPIVDASKEEIQKWSKECTYASFLCDQMKRLPVEHTQRVQCASRIIYLHYLIVLFKRSMFKRLSGSKCKCWQ